MRGCRIQAQPSQFAIIRFYLENHKFDEPNSSTTAPESWDVIETSEIADSPVDDLSIKSLEIRENALEQAKDHDNFAVKDSNILSQSDMPYSNQAEIQGDLVSQKSIQVPVSKQSKTPKEISLNNIYKIRASKNLDMKFYFQLVNEIFLDRR